MEISKDYINERAIAAYLNSGGFILLEIGMGVGKTKTALDIIAYRHRTSSIGKVVALFVCSTKDARDITIPDEIIKWDMRHLNITLVQYEGLDKINERIFDIVIFDECHNITPRRASFFTRNHCRSIICMTGTLPDDKERLEMLNKLTRNNTFKYSMAESTKNRTVNDVVINIIYAKMDLIEQSQYDEIERASTYAYAQGEQWRINRVKGQFTKFISGSPSKKAVADWVIRQLREKNRRFLIYCFLKEQADKYSPYRHYSGVRGDDLGRFMRGEINEVACINMLKESANIEGLTHAVITQLNSKYHNLEQIVGRLTRNNLDTIGKAYIICLRGTADERWVKKSTRRLKNKVREYVLNTDGVLEDA